MCKHAHLSLSICISLFIISCLFLVPFEVWEEDKADPWIRIFINNPVSLCLLLQDVVYPLVEVKVNSGPQLIKCKHKHPLRCRGERQH